MSRPKPHWEPPKSQGQAVGLKIFNSLTQSKVIQYRIFNGIKVFIKKLLLFFKNRLISFQQMEKM